MVGGVNGDFGGVNFGIDADIDRDFRTGFLGLAGQMGMMDMNIGIETEPIGRITAIDEIFDIVSGPVNQRFAERHLGIGNARIAAVGIQATRQQIIGGKVKFTQKRCFPAVPDIGPDRTNIGHSQTEQKTQTFL